MEAVSPQHVDELIRQLGDKDYFVRQRAQEELTQLGFQVFDAVCAATTDKDLEIASRAKYLLKLMRVEWTIESDPPLVKRYLHDYESSNPAGREERMGAIAALPDGQGTAALCRLVRFEKLSLLSRKAALALLTSQVKADPPDAATAETIRKTLDNCKRPGAIWLLTWARLGGEPEAMMAEWTKLIDAEQALLEQAQSDTDADVVMSLIRFQVLRLKKLGKADEAMTAARRLVGVTPDDPDALLELLQWLVDQKAWKAVDDLRQRFSQQVANDPGLLYVIAESDLEQGKTDQAEEAARRAFALNPGKQEAELRVHYALAMYLLGAAGSPGRGASSNTSSPKAISTTTTFRRRRARCWPKYFTTRARTSMRAPRWRSC